jgi:hypothetical protein
MTMTTRFGYAPQTSAVADLSHRPPLSRVREGLGSNILTKVYRGKLLA